MWNIKVYYVRGVHVIIIKKFINNLNAIQIGKILNETLHSQLLKSYNMAERYFRVIDTKMNIR